MKDEYDFSKGERGKFYRPDAILNPPIFPIPTLEEYQMPDRATIEKLIKDAYAARIAKDLDAVMPFFTPNATFQFAGSSTASPAAVRVQGVANLRATFGALIAAFDILDLALLASVIEGNKAATHWRVKIKHNPTGEVHDTELFDLWTLEGGRISSFVQFADTALVASLMARTNAGGDKQ
jgi:ketosteroid isomerase-like protein